MCVCVYVSVCIYVYVYVYDVIVDIYIYIYTQIRCIHTVITESKIFLIYSIDCPWFTLVDDLLT